jgi:hypothetical protein
MECAAPKYIASKKDLLSSASFSQMPADQTYLSTSALLNVRVSVVLMKARRLVTKSSLTSAPANHLLTAFKLFKLITN